MKRILILAILAGSLTHAQAQGQKTERTVDLWGHVKSAYIKQGILGAKVTLMRADSTIADTMTVFQEWHGDNKIDAAYKFVIPARRGDRYIIRAEHPDYETLDINFTVPTIARNTLFEANYHFMKPRRKSFDMEGSIDEVVVKKTRIRVYAKGDTLVYNADAFKLNEGSMLDDLIRQMPGAHLSDDGQITVNGEKIDELTLNGKDFFGGKTKVMLENLPYYLVNQLKVYHKTSDRSEWLGREVEQKKYVMDVVLKREYAVGMTGNASLGGGTEDLWLARLFALRYTNNSRLAIYGNANNISQNARPGIYNNQGLWGRSSTWGGRELYKTIGADLLIDDADKKWQDNLSGDVTWRKDDYQDRRSTERFLANGGSIFGRSATNEIAHNFSVNAVNKFKTEDPKNPWHTHANTEFHFTQRDSRSLALEAQTDADPSAWGGAREMLDSAFALGIGSSLQSILVNRSRTQDKSDGRTVRGKGDFGVYRKTAWGDDGGLNFRIDGSKRHSYTYEQQRIDYFKTQADGSETTDPYTQNRYTQGHPDYDYDYAIAPYYSLHLPHSWNIYTDYTYNQHFALKNTDTYRLDRLAGYDALGNTLGTLPSTRDSMLLALDANNSNRQTAMKRTHAYAVALSRSHTVPNKSYTWFRLYLTGRYFSDRLHYDSQPADTTLSQHRLTIEPDIELTHRMQAKSDSTFSREYWVHYNFKEELPSLLNKVNVHNDINPLAIRLGNPNLRGVQTHSFGTSFGRTRSRTYTHWGVAADLDFYRNNISQGYTYDPATGVYTYRPMNVNGNWHAKILAERNGDFNRKGKLNYSLSTSLHYNRNVDHASLAGLSESALSHVNNWNLTGMGSLGYRGNNLQLKVKGDINARWANQREGFIDNVRTVDFNYGVEADYDLPFKIQLSNSLTMYSRRGYSDSSLNSNELIWNLSLYRSLIKRKLSLRLDCYDLLHQQSSTMGYVNGQGRIEIVRNRLPGYAMLTLEYRFQKFPKKSGAAQTRRSNAYEVHSVEL